MLTLLEQYTTAYYVTSGAPHQSVSTDPCIHAALYSNVCMNHCTVVMIHQHWCDHNINIDI